MNYFKFGPVVQDKISFNKSFCMTDDEGWRLMHDVWRIRTDLNSSSLAFGSVELKWIRLAKYGISK